MVTRLDLRNERRKDEEAREIDSGEAGGGESLSHDHLLSKPLSSLYLFILACPSGTNEVSEWHGRRQASKGARGEWVKR